MIVYSATKSQFLNDVMSNDIGNIILSTYKKVTGKSTGQSEITSWTNSLQFMDRVLSDGDIPGDSGVAIEYHIPQSSKRIDFILTGIDDEQLDSAILIELKQWQKAEITEKDALVITRFKHGEKETPHPSYQAWSYKRLLEDYNQTVEEENIKLYPCAYLHNYDQDEVISNVFYKEYIDQAPLFLKRDALKLRNFIKSHVKYGDKNKIMHRIDNGRIRPSKNLADQLKSMLSGNEEFVMIDEQKVVYETAHKLAKESSGANKNVLIVEGGPGTGKSVLAINLLVSLTDKERQVVQYVTKNSAPREVYEAKLTGSFKKSHITNMFSGSGSYHSVDKNLYDTLIVDEAHRLNAKSGMFSHLGENQVKEIINASKFSVFFVDEDQQVTLKDIGQKSEIKKWADSLGARVTELELESQFRCNGSDGYLAWLDQVLQIRETANETIEDLGYDFKIFDDPQKLHETILDKNKEKNKARMVAGYCWKWVSKRHPELKDIQIGNYKATWNLNEHGQAWVIHKDSVSEVGCIHTCQGLEVDYIGVIIGPDLIVRDNKIVTVPEERASTDKSIHGWKGMMKLDPNGTRTKVDRIIKNTYRTLMTRGMKGCYVYFTDKETEKYFKSRIENKDNFSTIKPVVEKILSPYTKEMVGVPLVGSAPCGEPLLGESNVEEIIMVEKSKLKPGTKYFILRANGDSMNMAGINDGDLVLCRYSEKGETGDRVVALLDGEKVTIKEYGPRIDGVRLLLPKSSNKYHSPITPGDGDTVQGIVQEVIKQTDVE